MPAESERQRRFMGAELGRLRSGEATETGMSESQLEDFASSEGLYEQKMKTKKAPKVVTSSNTDHTLVKAMRAITNFIGIIEKASPRSSGKPTVQQALTSTHTSNIERRGEQTGSWENPQNIINEKKLELTKRQRQIYDVIKKYPEKGPKALAEVLWEDKDDPFYKYQYPGQVKRGVEPQEYGSAILLETALKKIIPVLPVPLRKELFGEEENADGVPKWKKPFEQGTGSARDMEAEVLGLWDKLTRGKKFTYKMPSAQMMADMLTAEGKKISKRTVLRYLQGTDKQGNEHPEKDIRPAFIARRAVRVDDLYLQGASVRQTANKMGISLSQVERLRIVNAAEQKIQYEKVMANLAASTSVQAEVAPSGQTSDDFSEKWRKYTQSILHPEGSENEEPPEKEEPPEVAATVENPIPIRTNRQINATSVENTEEDNVALSSEGTRSRTNVNKSSDKQLMDITLKAFSEYINILEKERLIDTARERGLAGLGTEAGLTIQEGFRRTSDAALGGAKKLAYGTDKVLTGAMYGKQGLARRKRAMAARRQPVKPQEQPPSKEETKRDNPYIWDGSWQKDSSQSAKGDYPGSTWEMPFSDKWTEEDIDRKLQEYKQRWAEANVDSRGSKPGSTYPSQANLPPTQRNEMRKPIPENIQPSSADVLDRFEGAYQEKQLMEQQEEEGLPPIRGRGRPTTYAGQGKPAPSAEGKIPSKPRRAKVGMDMSGSTLPKGQTLANKRAGRTKIKRHTHMNPQSERLTSEELLPSMDSKGNFISNKSIPFTPDKQEVLATAFNAIDSFIKQMEPPPPPPEPDIALQMETPEFETKDAGDQSTKWGRRASKKNKQIRGRKKMVVDGSGSRQQFHDRDTKILEQRRRREPKI